MNYYKRHIGDYLKDTAHLSLLEHGVYTRLLDVYYTREGGIPAQQAARLVSARSKAEVAALTIILEEFFQLADGVWIQTRCEQEIQDAEAQSKVNRENGRKGGRPKALDNQTETDLQPESQTQPEATANPLGFDSLTEKNPTHKPLANNHKPEEPKTQRAPRFDAQAHLVSLSVDPQVAEDWLKLRKGKRLASTETAFAGVQAEAEKAGLSLDAALRICCARGWGGFDASWLTAKDSRQAPANLNRQEALEARNNEIAQRWAQRRGGTA